MPASRNINISAYNSVPGMTHEKIAEVLGCTKQNVYQIERRALQKLGRKRLLLDALRELAAMARRQRAEQERMTEYAVSE